jgi:hypothetical protein
MTRAGRLVIAVAAASLALAGEAAAAPPAKPALPAAPLPMLPSVARVRLLVTKAQIVVVEEVSLPRGEWKGEPFDVYVAFGAPGAPRAIDAHLVPVTDGALEAADDVAGDALATDRAPRRPSTAHPLLGRDTMAGVVVHVTKEAMARALAPGDMAALRVRTAIDLPERDPEGGMSVLVRLGASRGTPLTLGRIVVASVPGGSPIARAEARLCGPESDAHPLAVALAGARPSNGRAEPERARIAPVLAVRHASDDLCVRMWTAP